MSANDIVRVDRLVRPAYPDWMKKLLHPELEATGPAEYALSSLQLSLHPKQDAEGLAIGQEVYEYQKQLGLAGCLGLSDLLAIQQLGPIIFRRYFQGKAVFAWKSVVQDDKYLDVPYLVEDNDRVILDGSSLSNGWLSRYPALRFAK